MNGHWAAAHAVSRMRICLDPKVSRQTVRAQAQREGGGWRQDYGQDQARCRKAHQSLSQARGIGDQEHKRKYGYDPSDHSDAEPTTAEVLAHVPTRGQGGQVGAQHQRECTGR